MEQIIPTRSTSSQKKFLNDKLADIKGKFNRARWGEDDAAEPANIIAARKLIKSFEKKRAAAKVARSKKQEAIFYPIYDKAKEAVLFGSPEEALAAVNAVEKIKV